MNKDTLVFRLADMTAHLTPEGNRINELKRLRSELAEWLVQNYETVAAGAIKPSQLPNEGLLSPQLKAELAETIEEHASSSAVVESNKRIVKREFTGTTDLGNLSAHAWTQGRQPKYSLGPFKDEYGKLIWFDIFNSIQLSTATFKGESVPFLKFSADNFLSTHGNQEINLGQGTTWIRASYLNDKVPSNAFVGLKIQSGLISFNDSPSYNGGQVLLNRNTICRVVLQLQTLPVSPNNPSGTGRDANDARVNLPKEIVLSFAVGKGIVESINDSDFRIYGNKFKVHFEESSWVYEETLQRVALPFQFTTTIFSITQVTSTIFKPCEKAKVDGVSWALPLTIDDHTKLGEASGNGGFLIKTDVGLEASWTNLDGGPIKLDTTYWLVEPGKIELHAFGANGSFAKQRFRLWQESSEGKNSSIAIAFLKKFYLKYVCLGLEEAEVLSMNVNLKGHLDRPLTTDGKRVKSNYANVQYSLGKYKQDVLLQCITKNPSQVTGLTQNRPLKPVSFALSNAFAKVSPNHEFFLVGQLKGTDLIEKGTCIFVFGLYSFVPIFPDPYVTNIQFTEQIETGHRAEKFHNYLQSWVRWAASIPTLTFHLPAPMGQLFSILESRRRGVYNSLKERNSSRPISYPIQTTDKNGNVITEEYNVAKVIEEDAHNDQNLKKDFERSSHGSFYPDLFILDVSGNADQFGIGLSNRSIEATHSGDFFKLEGIQLVSSSNNVHLMTLPPVQWEAIRTIQNLDVFPRPFPSPAYSLDTGDPAIINSYSSYHLIPITPQAAVHSLVAAFKEPPSADQKANALINLPFGMKAFLQLEQAIDNGIVYKHITVKNTQPHFKKSALHGGNQLSIAVHLPHNDQTLESPGFNGAAIQTRNLVENNQALGLSVLGIPVDSIFNNEFKPGGHFPRVPLRRVDLSGYGASMFSDWANPKAKFGATSKTKFDVIVGRTSHEIVQVRSKLYACGASVVRTITIQRTAGGGVTRHDSGWEPEGPGLFDFSYEEGGEPVKKIDFHLGLIKGFYNISNIRDTPRIIEIQPIEAKDELAKLQEVIYDADILVEDVERGQTNGYVVTKGQKGFIQLEPSGHPISPSQLKYLLTVDGPLGGPVDCHINVAKSGQEMRVVRVDTSPKFGSTEFVNAARGTLVLPNDGAWSIVRSKNKEIAAVESNAGLPLIQYNATPTLYEFSEPSEDPKDKYGLIHGSSSHRTLFLNPSITRTDKVIVTEQPYFADLYALVNSNNTFPLVADAFPVGASNGKLKVHSSGVLELISPGNLNILPKPRPLHTDANFATYIEYFDKNNKVSRGSIVINPSDPEKWKTEIDAFKLVYDIGGHKRMKMFHMNHYASGTQKPTMRKPVLEFGSILKPVGDMLRFLDTTDLGEFDIDPSNDKFKFKFKYSYGVKIKIETSEFPPFYFAKIIFLGKKGAMVLDGVPPVAAPIVQIEGKLAIVGSHDETGNSVSMKVAGDIRIQVVSFKAIAGYAVGLIEYKATFGEKAKVKKHSFMAAVGVAVKVKIPLLAEVDVMRAVGIEYESESGKVFALLSQKGELELFKCCSLGISLEAKAAVNNIVKDLPDHGVSLKRMAAQFELSLSIELTIAFVINFEFELAWSELLEDVI